MKPHPTGREGPRLPTIDVVIVSWQGYGERSRRIANQLAGLTGIRLRVIYSNAAEEPETGPGVWKQVGNDKYFGQKFAAALADFDGDVLMIIQADALCADWSTIVKRCQARVAARPRLGLWAPSINYTPWLPERVDIRSLPGEGLTAVAQTDAIVLAFSKDVVRRLNQLDFNCNNLGWGIDWIAICYCYTCGLEVLREDDVQVIHPPSRGYNWRQAVGEWRVFMRQMNDAEQSMFQILLRYTAEKRRGVLGKLITSLARRRASRMASRLD